MGSDDAQHDGAPSASGCRSGHRRDGHVPRGSLSAVVAGGKGCRDINNALDFVGAEDESPRSAAPWRLVSVRPGEDFRLHVVFVDGTARDVHLRPFNEGPSTKWDALRGVTRF